MARLVVPQMADWCAVDLLEEAGVRREVVTCRQGALDSLPTGPEGLLPAPDPDSEAPIERVLRGAGPLLLTRVDPGREPSSPLHAAHLQLCRMLGVDSMILTPLRSRRQVLGALTLARCDPRRALSEDDLALVEDLAHRVALAVDNAHLYAAQQDVATRMQLSLLPELPRVDHLRLAARYLPARESLEVGGDWYDAFLLPDGVLALAIGDVSGHDLSATVGMAQLRNMMRALAWDRTEPPGEILRRLDSAMQGVGIAHTATAILARLEGPEGGPWQLHWSNAGHPPPLLVTHDGDTHFLDPEHGPLLGLEDEVLRPDLLTPLPERSSLLLYTDGLVERRGEPLGRGMARLRQHAAALARDPVEVLCDELLSGLADAGEDDVALLALRLPPAGAGAHHPHPG